MKNRSDRKKDSVRPGMHHATCNNCGRDCEVPFKPTSGKPIYCSSCFEKSQNKDQKKYGHERGDRRLNVDENRKRGFDNSKDKDQLKKEFEKLNKKLDRILEFLTPEPAAESYQVKWDEETEEPIFERKTRKKMVLKKKNK